MHTSFTVIRSSDSPSPIHLLLSAPTTSHLLHSSLYLIPFPLCTFSPPPHLLPPFTLSLFLFIPSLLHLTSFFLLPFTLFLFPLIPSLLHLTSFFLLPFTLFLFPLYFLSSTSPPTSFYLIPFPLYTFSPPPHLLPPFTLSLFPFIPSPLHLTFFPFLPSLFLPLTIFPKLHPLPLFTFSPPPLHSSLLSLLFFRILLVNIFWEDMIRQFDFFLLFNMQS